MGREITRRGLCSGLYEMTSQQQRHLKGSRDSCGGQRLASAARPAPGSSSQTPLRVGKVALQGWTEVVVRPENSVDWRNPQARHEILVGEKDEWMV